MSKNGIKSPSVVTGALWPPIWVRIFTWNRGRGGHENHFPPNFFAFFSLHFNSFLQVLTNNRFIHHYFVFLLLKIDHPHAVLVLTFSITPKLFILFVTTFGPFYLLPKSFVGLLYFLNFVTVAVFDPITKFLIVLKLVEINSSWKYNSYHNLWISRQIYNFFFKYCQYVKAILVYFIWILYWYKRTYVRLMILIKIFDFNNNSVYGNFKD